MLDGADAASQLDRALGAGTYGAFFAGLGTSEKPFVIAASQVDKGIQLVVERLDRGRQARTAVRAARLVRPFSRSESSSPILWWIGGVVGVLYFISRVAR